jgi:AcrR family transcriptional regulator
MGTRPPARQLRAARKEASAHPARLGGSFATRGFEARASGTASRAPGVSRGAVFLHFGSKAALFKEACVLLRSVLAGVRKKSGRAAARAGLRPARGVREVRGVQPRDDSGLRALGARVPDDARVAPGGALRTARPLPPEGLRRDRAADRESRAGRGAEPRIGLAPRGNLLFELLDPDAKLERAPARACALSQSGCCRRIRRRTRAPPRS